ncbi:MAG: hypothetical protein MJZ34_02885 [Paludibacteraceae bacterium]|nr:hypothetical protein [Paludibacteraceae bacterium]
MSDLSNNDMLNYLSYTNMIDGTRELLTSDKWDWEILEPPSAVYYPGMDFIKRRVSEITFPADAFNHTAIDTPTIRGFQVPAQPGQIPLKNQSVTIKFVDYEDQTMYVWLTDWAFKCCDPITQKSYRASDLRCRNKYWRLNALNKPVRSWVHEHCIINGYNIEEPMDSQKSTVGEAMSLTFLGILLPPKFENLSAV